MWMLNKNQQFLFVSFFLLTLVIILNLKIPIKYKLTLILLGIVICFYEPKFIIPFLTSIVVVYLSNKQISKFTIIPKKVKHKKKSKKVVEGFSDIETVNKLFENPLNLKRDLTLENISILEKNINKDVKPEKYLVNTFLRNIFQVYFFEYPTDLPLALKLYLKYDSVKQIQDDLLFVNIATENSYSDDPYRENRIDELKDETLKKLGFLIYKSPFQSINTFFLSQINNLGLYSILNQQYSLDDPGLDDKVKYEKLRKNIYEVAILIFYLTHREGTDKFNFNTQIDLEPIHLSKLVPDFFKNIKSKTVDSHFDLLETKINNINVDLYLLSPNNDIVNKNPLFPPNSLFNNIFEDNDKPSKDKNPIKENSSSKLLETKLNLYFDSLEEYVEELELLDIEIYKVAEKYQRKELEFIIMSNYLLMILIKDTKKTEKTKLNHIIDLFENYFYPDEKISRIGNENIRLYNKKQQKFKLQIENEKTVEQKHRFTSLQDILYDYYYFYLGNYLGNTDLFERYLIYPEIEVISPNPSPSGSVNPISDMQQANFEMDLDEYLDKNALHEKQEEALNQYYKFLDKENYEKIQGLNKLAERRNEELKLQELSFNNIIDNFGKEIFSMIDEIILVVRKFYLDEDLVELQSKINNSLSNPTFQENFSSPGPSPGPSPNNNLSKFDKYILFVKIILDILLRQNRIVYTGFIFIVLAVLIYFIDISCPSVSRSEKSGINSIFDLLKL